MEIKKQPKKAGGDAKDCKEENLHAVIIAKNYGL